MKDNPKSAAAEPAPERTPPQEYFVTVEASGKLLPTHFHGHPDGSYSECDCPRHTANEWPRKQMVICECGEATELVFHPRRLIECWNCHKDVSIARAVAVPEPAAQTLFSKFATLHHKERIKTAAEHVTERCGVLCGKCGTAAELHICPNGDNYFLRNEFTETWPPAKPNHGMESPGTNRPEPAAQQESGGMLQFFGFEIKEATSYVQVYPFTGPHIFRKGERERMATEEENFMWLALKKFWSDSEDEVGQAEPAPTPSRELEDLRKRMAEQIRSLLKYSAECWKRGDREFGIANDDKARFLWCFMPRMDGSEFNAEFAEIRKAQDAWRAAEASAQGTKEEHRSEVE